MLIIRDFEQGTDEWFKAKAGVPSSSCFDKILDSKGKRSTQRKTYMYKLAGEKITGTYSSNLFQTAAMKRGNDLEPEARDYFSFTEGLPVDQVALIYNDDNKRYSCSPDGLISEKEEGLEIKCPELATAVKYLDDNKLPTKYKLQVQGSMAVTGYTHWWFLSYYPGLKPLILKVERDEAFIDIIKAELNLFCDELDDLVLKLADE